MKSIRPLLFAIPFILLLSCNVLKSSRVKSSEQEKVSPTVAPIELSGVKIRPADAKRNVMPDKQIDILHTDLDIKFNWGKHECMGKAVIRLKPYFYEIDSISLDAHHMVFDGIQILNNEKQPIEYLVNYNQHKLVLKLEHKITRFDTLDLIISYIARPDENVKKGGKAIRDDKGLYFINTRQQEPYKPVQIWTQGETESNSCWFPTIDIPSEKFTSSVTMHVNKELTTLSNGIKTTSFIEENTLTETWENKFPMPAYLMMMAVGNFTQIIEPNTQPEVSYYLEKEYAPFARRIFQHTPEMIEFYSNKLGVNYPWAKYAQIVVRDYVSGAMENTSATLHGESVQKNDRELVDKNNDDIISHELFHQWFGDLATCKTWGQLVLNEGFASYGELLWNEYKYGAEAALKKSNAYIQRYLSYAKSNDDHAIIYDKYLEPDDMFNAITYQKGAAVIHLLRQTIGDEAFFEVLKNYLTHYSFSNADIYDFKKEVEQVCGKDMSPFFNQWFIQPGHPSIDIHYQFIDTTGLVELQIEQKQTDVGLFDFPLKFKISQEGQTRTFTFQIHKKKEVFYVRKIQPDMQGYPTIFVDPDASFIGDITDNKPLINYLHTYNKYSNYIEKNRTLNELAKIQSQIDTARFTLLSAINDPLPEIRLQALESIDWSFKDNLTNTKEVLSYMVKNDSSSLVRAKVVDILGNSKDPLLLNLFYDATEDSSYTVAGNALRAVYNLLPDEALHLIPKLRLDAKGRLFESISEIIKKSGDTSYVEFYTSNLMKVFSRKRANLMNDYTDYVIRLQQSELIDKAIENMHERGIHDEYPYVRFVAVECLKELNDQLSAQMKQSTDENRKAKLNQQLGIIAEYTNALMNNEQDEYVIGLFRLKGWLQANDNTTDQ